MKKKHFYVKLIKRTSNFQNYFTMKKILKFFPDVNSDNFDFKEFSLETAYT